MNKAAIKQWAFVLLIFFGFKLFGLLGMGIVFALAWIVDTILPINDQREENE